jgi:hypothetical protein
MIGSPSGGKASPSLPFSATNYAGNTPTVTDANDNNTKMNNGNASTTSINTDDPNWKSKLTIPEKDLRARTSDVTNTSGHDFEDYCLKRELLMGMFYKHVDEEKNLIFRYL